MQNECLFCPFQAQSRLVLLQHCEAEHTRGLENVNHPAECSCGFRNRDWETFRIHLWEDHGGGLRNRPSTIVQLSSDELRQLITQVLRQHNAQDRPPISMAPVFTQPPPNFYATSSNVNAHDKIPHNPENGFVPIAFNPRDPPPVNRNLWQGSRTNPSTVQGQEPVRNGYNIKRPYIEPEPEPEPDVEPEPEPEVKKTKLSCTLCKRMFDSQESLLQHKADSHPYGQTTVYSCSECGCQFLIWKTGVNHIVDFHELDEEEAESHLSTRSVGSEELPLFKCDHYDCKYRTVLPQLQSHRAHAALFVSAQEIRKRRLEASREQNDKLTLPKSDWHPKTIDYLNSLHEHGVSEKNNNTNSYQERTNSSTKPHQQSSPPQDPPMQMIKCYAEDGYIKIPANGLQGRYVMVPADKSGSAPDIILDIVQPKEPKPSTTKPSTPNGRVSTPSTDSSGSSSRHTPPPTHSRPLLPTPKFKPPPRTGPLLPTPKADMYSPPRPSPASHTKDFHEQLLDLYTMHQGHIKEPGFRK